MISFLKNKNIIVVAMLIFFIVLLLINFIYNTHNYNAISDNNTLKIETEAIKQRTSAIITDIIHGADLSVRGFALTKNEQLVDPIKIVLKNKDSVFNSLEVMLNKQHYDMTKYNEMKSAVEDYLTFSLQMIQLARQDSMKQFAHFLNEDRGYGVWRKYKSFYEPLFAYEDSLNAAASKKYLDAMFEDRIIQLLLLLLGCPTVVYIIRKLRSDEREREGFLIALDQSNRKYIFDANIELKTRDWKEIIAGSIKNFQHANEFITKIAAGDYATEWNGLNEFNKANNQTNLAGNLIKMRENLKQSKNLDDQRNWAVAGQAKLAEIIRQENDFQKLGDIIISYVVNYTNSNQGALFVLKDENEEDVHLSLLSCYAWDKKKHIDKRIYAGQGLVGQCWLEQEPTFMTQIPANYVNITSGLGHATPRCIFIAPLKVNNIIYGVLELASFEPYLEHERQFILSVSETIASAISNTKVTARTNYLLEQSRIQAEELRTHEEEMRQNVEELIATQEGIERIMRESKDKELYMRNLIDASTDSILTFNHEYKIIHFNKAAGESYKALGIALNNKDVNLLKLLPSSDQLMFKQMFDKALSGEFGEISYESITGRNYIIKYIPIKNEAGKTTAVAQFSTDVTVLMNAQRDTKAMLVESQAQAEELRSQEEELRATMEAEAQRSKDLERANSQSEAQKLMMNKLIEKLKMKEKENQIQTNELRAQEEQLRAQQEELRQNIEELQATLVAETKRNKEAEQNKGQLEAQEQMMTNALQKFKQRESELVKELELREKTIANLTRAIRDN